MVIANSKQAFKNSLNVKYIEKYIHIFYYIYIYISYIYIYIYHIN